MRQFFDTSVVLAAFLADHEQHPKSLRVFREVNANGECAAHTLAELYAVSTRLPVRNRLSGSQALMLLENVRKRLRVVHLHADDYFHAFEAASACGIAGAVIYDALIVVCAAKSHASITYTWNVNDFQRVAPSLADRICVPQ